MYGRLELVVGVGCEVVAVEQGWHMMAQGFPKESDELRQRQGVEERVVPWCWQGISLERRPQGDAIHRSGHYVASMRPVTKELGLEIREFVYEKWARTWG